MNPSRARVERGNLYYNIRVDRSNDYYAFIVMYLGERKAKVSGPLTVRRIRISGIKYMGTVHYDLYVIPSDKELWEQLGWFTKIRRLDFDHSSLNHYRVLRVTFFDGVNYSYNDSFPCLTWYNGYTPLPGQKSNCDPTPTPPDKPDDSYNNPIVPPEGRPDLTPPPPAPEVRRMGSFLVTYNEYGRYPLISWGSVPGAAYYVVYRNGVEVQRIYSRSFSVTSSGEYRVVAFNNKGQAVGEWDSSYINVSQYRDDNTPKQGIITGFRYIETVNDFILTWDEYSETGNTVSYDIYRNGVYIATVHGTSYTAKNEGNYKVVARDNRGRVIGESPTNGVYREIVEMRGWILHNYSCEDGAMLTEGSITIEEDFNNNPPSYVEVTSMEVTDQRAVWMGGCNGSSMRVRVLNDGGDVLYDQTFYEWEGDAETFTLNGLTPYPHSKYKVEITTKQRGTVSSVTGKRYETTFEVVDFKAREYWEVDVPPFNSKLMFYIDGKLIDTYTEMGTFDVAYTVPRGKHEFKWVYETDNIESSFDFAEIDWLRLTNWICDKVLITPYCDEGEGDKCIEALIRCLLRILTARPKACAIGNKRIWLFT